MAVTQVHRKKAYIVVLDIYFQRHKRNKRIIVLPSSEQIRSTQHRLYCDNFTLIIM